MRKRAAVLCMLAGLLMLLSGCMAGDVSLVDMSVEQPDPVSGKYQTLAPDQNGLTSGEFLFILRLFPHAASNDPAVDSTFDDITLGKDLFFTITNTATQKQYRLTNITLARDPSISYVKDMGNGAIEDRLGLLVAYENIDPGSYSVTNMGGTITYRTETGTAEQTLRASSIGGEYNNSFTVVTPVPTATPKPKPTDAPTPTPTPTSIATATPTVMPTPTVTSTAMPTVTPFVPPKTGDNAAPWTWGVLLLVCGAGLLLMYRRTRS